MINIISYMLYFGITFYITIVVGWKFYKIGFIYLKNLIEDAHICESINRMLLLGYYLLNLGYVAIQINGWETITNLSDMVSVLGKNIGIILLTLCLMHYFNMTLIYLLRKKSIHNHKN